MSKELLDLDKKLRSPPFDKNELKEKLIDGIEFWLVHAINNEQLMDLAIEHLQLYKKSLEVLAQTTLEEIEPKTDEEFMLMKDKASHVLKIAKALLEPTVFNINLVKKAFEDIKDMKKLFEQKAQTEVNSALNVLDSFAPGFKENFEKQANKVADQPKLDQEHKKVSSVPEEPQKIVDLPLEAIPDQGPSANEPVPEISKEEFIPFRGDPSGLNALADEDISLDKIFPKKKGFFEQLEEEKTKE